MYFLSSVKGDKEMFENTLAEVNGGRSSMDNSLMPVDLEPSLTSWSCLKSGQQEEGKLDMKTNVTDEAQMKYQVGNLHFSDRTYSTLFYGEGYKQSIIIRSVPNIPNEQKVTDEAQMKYQVGSLHFSDRPYSMIFYGEGYKQSIITRSVPNIPSEERGSSNSYSRSVRQDLNNAAMSFIMEFNSEFEAICSKKFQDFSNLTVCIEGLPEQDRFLSLEAFAELPGNHFAEPRTICAGKSSLTVADTTVLGRVIGIDLLQYIFEAHAAKKTWNGQFDIKTIFVRNGSKVEIRKPFYHKFSDDARLNDIIRYVDDFFPLYRLEKLGLPAFFSHLGRSLKNFPPSQFRFPDQLQRFRRFALTHLALKHSMKRVVLFSGLYRIRQTRHVRWLLKTILKSNAYEGVGSDWRKESLLQQHPILKRVLNHRKDDDKRKDDNHRKDDDSRAQDMTSEKFSNTPDGLVVFVRHTNEHGVDGPEDNKEIEVEGAATTAEEEEDPIIMLSDLDLLYSHCLQSFLPDILEEIIFCENVPNQLNIMLEEVLEVYNQPENIKNCV